MLLVLIKEIIQCEFESGLQIFIYVVDQYDFFVVIVVVMDQFNLSIQDVWIIIFISQFIFDIYIVFDVDGDFIGNNLECIVEICEGFIDVLKNFDDYLIIIQCWVLCQFKYFVFVLQVIIFIDVLCQVLVFEVIVFDCLGLLVWIGGIFLDFDLLVQNVKIVIFGECVEDVFYIIDVCNQLFVDFDLCKCLQVVLVEQLL